MNETFARDQEVQFESAGLSLSGTLSVPVTGTPSAVVLMLQGSGQTDRNDNAGRMKIDLFEPLVERLAEMGIATFRYDKRGVGKSQGDYWSSGFYDLEADAREAISYLMSAPQVNAEKVYILGHSEGAMLAAKLASGKSQVTGAVLLAGSAKTGEETILWQTAKIAQSLKGLNKAIIRLFKIDVKKSLKKNLLRIKEAKGDYTRIQGQKINAKWMREFLAYDPVPDLEKVNLPVLALTGSKDVQVDPADIELMSKVINGPTTAQVLPGLSHLFRVDPTDDGVAGYKKQLKHPVDESVLKAVTDWFRDKQ